MAEENLFRVLSLDGGGAKGFYTLGILREIEALIDVPLSRPAVCTHGASVRSPA